MIIIKNIEPKKEVIFDSLPIQAAFMLNGSLFLKLNKETDISKNNAVWLSVAPIGKEGSHCDCFVSALGIVTEVDITITIG